MGLEFRGLRFLSCAWGGAGEWIYRVSISSTYPRGPRNPAS